METRHTTIVINTNRDTTCHLPNKKLKEFSKSDMIIYGTKVTGESSRGCIIVYCRNISARFATHVEGETKMLSQKNVMLFQNDFDDLINAIIAPEPLSWKLYTKGLIDLPTLDKALMVVGVPLHSKTCAILENLQLVVRRNPHVLPSVLEVLQDHGRFIIENIREEGMCVWTHTST